MILGVGIDTVDIHRFDDYQNHAIERLLKLFSQDEINYCLSKPHPASHFAGRFAVREAFFKAYQGMLHHYQKEHPATLLTINKNIEVCSTQKGLPFIKINWPALLPTDIAPAKANVSITHTETIATAIVILTLL